MLHNSHILTQLAEAPVQGANTHTQYTDGDGIRSNYRLSHLLKGISTQSLEESVIEPVHI